MPRAALRVAENLAMHFTMDDVSVSRGLVSLVDDVGGKRPAPDSGNVAAAVKPVAGHSNRGANAMPVARLCRESCVTLRERTGCEHQDYAGNEDCGPFQHGLPSSDSGTGLLCACTAHESNQRQEMGSVSAPRLGQAGEKAGNRA